MVFYTAPALYLVNLNEFFVHIGAINWQNRLYLTVVEVLMSSQVGVVRQWLAGLL